MPTVHLSATITHLSGLPVTDHHALQFSAGDDTWHEPDGWGGLTFTVCPDHAHPDLCTIGCETASVYRLNITSAQPTQQQGRGPMVEHDVTYTGPDNEGDHGWDCDQPRCPGANGFPSLAEAVDSATVEHTTLAAA